MEVRPLVPARPPTRSLIALVALGCLLPAASVGGQQTAHADWFFIAGSEDVRERSPSLAGTATRDRTGGIGVVCGAEGEAVVWLTHAGLEASGDDRVHVRFGFDGDSVASDVELLPDRVSFRVPGELLRPFLARMALGTELSVRVESPGRAAPLELAFSLDGFMDAVTGLPCLRRSEIMLYAARLGLSETPGGPPVPTPMTVRPRLLNARRVSRAMEEHYPPQLREFGVGGTVNVWFFIDETGRVRDAVVNEPCRYESINRAALKVAKVMRFSPAYNDGEIVPVWVALDVTFEVAQR